MRRATLKDVAIHAGVSPATVSYVLNGKKKTISKETKERIYKAVKELEYIPDMNARGLAAKDTKLIGVVVPQTEPGSKLMFQNDFYSEILGSIEYHARLRGYHVIISGTNVDENYMKLVQERNLAGVIIIGMYADDFYEQFKKIQIPVVLIDCYCKDNFFHDIRIDDAFGSYQATQYVINQGHRAIAFLCGTLKENGVMKKRFNGYCQALLEAGIPFRQDYVFEGEVDYESGITFADRIADDHKGITAIVAMADTLAIGIMKGLYNRGVKVPEDISVMGFDDLEISGYLIPGLTTIKQDISLKGEHAVELLVKNMNDPDMDKQEEVLPTGLTVRDSVRKIN